MTRSRIFTLTSGRPDRTRETDETPTPARSATSLRPGLICGMRTSYGPPPATRRTRRKTMTRWTRRPEGSNWGEFGDDAQLGRLNLIRAERRLAAVREVREGIAFPLSLPLDFPRGEYAAGPRKPPVLSS